jgi:hypothetical protein
MSSPKLFKAEVFNKSLNEIFQLQSRIQYVIDELSQLSVGDNERSIKFNCLEFIKLQQSKINHLLSTFSISFEGTINQTKHDTYQKEIKTKINDLEAFIEIAEKEKANFHVKQKDYKDYINYELFYKHSIESFESFKVKLINYLECNLKDKHLSIFNTTKASIEAIKIELKIADFEFGFQNKRLQKQDELQTNLAENELLINDIRAKLSDKISVSSDTNLSIFSQIDLSKLRDVNKMKQDVKFKIIEIEKLIYEINNPYRKAEYINKLENLIQSESLKDIYFYIELIDEIKQTEKIHRWKTEIKEILSDINQLKTHIKIESEKNTLTQDCLSLLSKRQVKKNEFEDVRTQMKLLKKKNEKAKNEDFFKAKENHFIKVQLIKSLESLNYEVMEDMEVIDFEKESDLLFHIPQQNNYLNLRFKQDGFFHYNFVIPESKDELSISQKERKLIEMENTCNEFKELLKSLSAKGLSFHLHRELPLSETTLVQIPEKHRSHIKKMRKDIKKEKMIKKSYLN